MKNIPQVSIVLGTRPEAIKLAPVIIALRSIKEIYTRVILTGQHSEMVYQAMSLFQIEADVDFRLMKSKQSLNYITTSILNKLDEDFSEFPPNLVLVQGDTSTAFSASLAAFYKKITIGHVEAGLRTNSILNPFPEEVNRRLISQLSSYHFAPTLLAKKNLIKSGCLGEIYVTGNTVIDSLLLVAEKAKENNFRNINWTKKKVILVTIHRRENWGKNLENIANGIKVVANENEDCIFLVLLHKNKIVRTPLKTILSNHQRIILTEPLDYEDLISIMKKCYLVLTDSGGLQEEAPTFGKPVLVLRDQTERIEAINSGTAKLIGTDTKKIVKEVNTLLLNHEEYISMSKAVNPFGDGKASERIMKVCLHHLNIKSKN